MMKWLALLVIVLAMPSAWAAEVFPSVHSRDFPNQSEAPVSSRQADYLNIHYNISCWGPNGRSFVGPVHPQNCLKLTTNIEKDGTALAPFQLVFPALLIDPTRATPPIANGACPSPALANVPSGWSMDFTNPQRKEVNATVHTKVMAVAENVAADGAREVNKLRVKVASVNLTQDGMQRLPDGTWALGNDGFVSNNQVIVPSENGFDVAVYLQFGGAIQAGQRVRVRGFCDAFYSPLMLFFDNKWPQFTGITSFQVLPGSPWFVWPEPNAPGYFLAMDRNGNGRIDDGDELFGEDMGHGIRNGFEKLRQLDSDKNGKIDANDKQFHSLLLWNDANGNGISEPSELIPLSKMGVVEISLNYKKNQVYPVGGGAELRENATFVFRNDKGKLSQGEIFDVWLSPTAPPVRNAASVGK